MHCFIAILLAVFAVAAILGLILSNDLCMNSNVQKLKEIHANRPKGPKHDDLYQILASIIGDKNIGNLSTLTCSNNHMLHKHRVL